MPRDRSKPWGHRPSDDDPAESTEPTHPPTPGAWEEETANGESGRRAPRRGSRRNDDETNVGGSLLPGDDFGLAKVFEQALAPAYVDDGSDDAFERTEPVASIPPPEAPPVRRPPPPRPPQPRAPEPPPAPRSQEPRRAAPEPRLERARPGSGFPEDDLGPVEEFTISGLMPDELKAMADAARQATAAERSAREKNPMPPAGRLRADPPRTSRHDPDPLITGVLGGGFGGSPVDDEETLAMNASEHPDLLDRLRAPPQQPTSPQGREYHTFGAGLQRLDELPAAPSKSDKSVGGGILELLDGSPAPASPTGPHEAPGAASEAEEPDRPRRVSTNRAGSLGRSSQRAPTPSPARSRSVVPNSRTATPRPAPSRGELPRRGRSASSGSLPPDPRESLRGRPRATGPGLDTKRPSNPPHAAPRPSAGRAQDEEARIRAALAAVSDDEHTSWVQLDEPPAPSPARPPGNRPRASRPDPVDPGGSLLPGVTPMGMPRARPPEPEHEREQSLTMDLTQVSPGDEQTRLLNPPDEATVPNPRSSIGDEPTIPAPAPGDEPTLPVPVPPVRAMAEAAANAPHPAKPPSKAPPARSPSSTKKSTSSGGAKPPVEISPLGEEKSESYRDGALPWIASAFAVMVLGTLAMLFLGLLLYII